MRVVVFGAGALGSFFGGMLSKKHDVLLVGRKEHVDAINGGGLAIEGKTDFVAFPEASTSMREGDDADLVILTVKAYDTEEAVKEIAGKCSAPILSLQNGLRNEEMIERIAGADRAVGGVTTHGVRYVAPGRVEHTGIGETIVGEMDGSVSGRVKKFADALTGCGVHTEVSSNIKREIWRKAVVNAAINPLTAILRCRNGYLLENEHARKLMGRICREGMAVAGGLGLGIGDAMEKAEEVARLTAENQSSMLQSLLRKRRTEIEFINGEIARVGRKVGVETPVNSTIVEIIRAMES